MISAAGSKKRQEGFLLADIAVASIIAVIGFGALTTVAYSLVQLTTRQQVAFEQAIQNKETFELSH